MRWMEIEIESKLPLNREIWELEITRLKPPPVYSLNQKLCNYKKFYRNRKMEGIIEN